MKYKILNCPVHNNEMFYNFFHKQYACQMSACTWGKGVTQDRVEEAFDHLKVCEIRLNPANTTCHCRPHEPGPQCTEDCL